MIKKILSTLAQKWPEYLIEAIVIIVSILGAFALDNWNEYRKEKQTESKIISQLIDEYQVNLEQLNEKIEFRKSIISGALTMFELIDNPETVSYDSLVTTMSFLVNDPTFDPIYNDLATTGSLRIISNESLKKNLSTWQSEVAALKEMESAWQKVVEEQINPYFAHLGVQRDILRQLFNKEEIIGLWILDKSLKNVMSVTPSKSRVSQIDVLKDKRLEGLIANALAYNQFSNLQSFALKDKMEETLILLRKELKTK